MEPANRLSLRTSAAIRVLTAVLVAGAITALAIVALWGPLDVETSVIGYPAYYDFNFQNYFTGYYLIVGFFPGLALLLFLGLTRIGPTVGLAAPPARGPLRPGQRANGPSPASVPASELDAPTAPGWPAIALRVLFVGAVLGLEIGIAAHSMRLWLLLGAVGYSLAVIGIAALLGFRVPALARPQDRASAVNAIGAPLTVIGLVAVSAHTQLTVLADMSVNHYPWIPAWLAIAAAAALVAFVVARLRRRDDSGAPARVEQLAVRMIAAPVALFLLLASLPGDPGFFGAFDIGQGLVGNRLVGDGLLPWRDVVLTHGLLLDVIAPATGLGVFENSYWGNSAGFGVLVGPLYVVSTYFLLAHLFRRDTSFLLLFCLIVLGTTFAPVDARFVLLPLILLQLASVLDRPAAGRSILLGVSSVVQAILTPESVSVLLAIGAVLAAYEWYWRAPAAAARDAFRRTIAFAVTVAALAATFAAYMAIRGALDDVVYLTVGLLRGQSLPLDSAVPPGPNPGTASDLQFGIFALAPLAAVLFSFAYAVSRLRLRRPFTDSDWVMAVVVIFLLLYYQKFLSRMDTGHAYEPYAIALPLMLYIVYRVVTSLERAIRSRLPVGGRTVVHPIGLLLVAAVLVTSWTDIRNRVDDAPVRFRSQASERSQIPRLGYLAAFNQATFRDLRRTIDAYLPPGAPLFDFSNEPALFFYLLDRNPSTRYYLTAGLADSAELQSDLVDRLRQAPPKLIVFDDTDTDPSIIGLASFDGIPTMVRSYLVSRWILDHYHPLLATHGRSFYIRGEAPTPSEAGLRPASRFVTRGVPFLSQPCRWGYAPSFLSGPAQPSTDSTAVSARTLPAVRTEAKIQGAVVHRKTLPIQEPPGSRWTDYRWLEVESGGAGFQQSYFALSDRAEGSSPNREISFQSLPRSPQRLVIPVGSCAQWHGYRSRRLFLAAPPDQDIAAVRLIR